ncbi:MAG: response regulator [Desulfobacterales bacterium]|nr:response regulator [Desulfobacterales bacterium]
MENTLLLVDDEEGIRKVLGISIKDLGYAVYTASNGEEALKIFGTIHPPIVLTDIKMPGMDGIELLRKIKEQSPETEVIMITGHGDIDLAIKSLKFEATDFVTKPINDEALEIALKRACERIAMRKTIRDYTENLERIVAEKTKQLLDSERMAAIGETIAGLSHTIKNIVSSLKGGMFVLEKGIELDEKQYLIQGWEMVKGNVDKIKNLSLNLLNYAKSTELHFEMSNPNQPATEVAQLIIPIAKEHSIAFRTLLDENLPLISFDPEAIHLCLFNLVTNAIDACKEYHEGRKPKEIILQTALCESGKLEYRVKDNGCGMEQAVVQKIFQSFFTTKGTKGTGIGLMLTKKIIDAHHGSIHVFSEKDKGSEFIIKLPV